MRYETRRDVEVLLGLYQKLKESYDFHADSDLTWDMQSAGQVVSDMRLLEKRISELDQRCQILGIGEYSAEIENGLGLMAFVEKILVRHFGSIYTH